jgi:hypothetical protein
MKKEVFNVQSKRKPRFSPYLFWDMKRRGFDFDKHRLLMIERVCSRGLERDWQEMLKYYGWETVKKEVAAIGWLDARTLSFLSCVFDLPKEKFKCYKKRQSRKSYWDS